jgi:predicted negative regulator of RcsB-dependent stress response
MAISEDYLSDAEQEEALRNWWRENWAWILGGVVLGLALLAGWRFWTAHQEQQSAQAATLYDNVHTALEKKDLAGASKALDTLTASFDSSAYAQQGRLMLAKEDVASGKFDEATTLLRAVTEKSKDKEMADVARLRLAQLLVQQGKHDDALNQLKPDTLGKFAAAAREIRGDALIAKGDAEGARAEYAAALTGEEASIDRTLVELKLQEVGGTAPAKDASPAIASAGSTP